MIEKDLHQFLLMNYPTENESCEWKSFRHLKNAFSSWEGQDIISYVAAISNMHGGHLVVGVEDETLAILGIEDSYNYTTENLPSRLITKCTNLSSEGLWVEQFITADTSKKVWIIHVPKHLPRKPVYAHGKAWQRIGDSLVEMTAEREQTILNEQQYISEDWSAGIIADAQLSDLDEVSIKIARDRFRMKYPHLAGEMHNWDDITFLNKAKITINGKLTRASIILLGKPDSEHFLSPALARISWVLKDANNLEKDYQHFTCPFLLSVEEVFKKIRNLKYRYIRDETLFPEETDQYEPYVIREALHNSIAHQDYNLGGKINVIEVEDGRLIFSNLGTFLAGTIDEVIKQDAPPEKYRNPFLIQAMVNLNMIDTIGSGIKRMFNYQKQKLFPLPDYDLMSDKVKVTITGKILDTDYAKVLARHPNLALEEIILLDKVQKKNSITDVEAKYLRDKGLIEGRKPNYFISVKLAQFIGQKATYTRYKAFDNKYYEDLIVEAAKQHGSLSRKDVDELLLNKLSDSLTAKQKKVKINNILSSIRNKGFIRNIGTDKAPIWVMMKK